MNNILLAYVEVLLEDERLRDVDWSDDCTHSEEISNHINALIDESCEKMVSIIQVLGDPIPR